MSKLIIWQKQEMSKLRNDMNRLFDELRSGFGTCSLPGQSMGISSIDIYETKNSLTVHVDLPGCSPDDLDISITSDTLTIKGEKKSGLIGEDGNYKIFESRSGSFSRSFKLPCKVNVDDVKATYTKGKLNIIMSKWESETARPIEIELQ